MKFTATIALVCLLTYSSAEDLSSCTIEPDVKKGLTQLTLSLINKLSESAPGTNIAISPSSIYSALSLALAGSAGSTQTELLQALGLQAYNAKLTDAYCAIGSVLRSATNGSSSAKVFIANSVFLQNQFLIEEQYKKDVATYFKSSAQSVDFAKEGDKAVQFINKWVSENTNGKIKELYSEPLDSNTKAVLASAFYFNAKWKYPYSSFSTYSGEFKGVNEKIPLTFLKERRAIPYSVNDELEYEVIGIPYEQNEYMMYIILPFENQTVQNVISRISTKDINSMFLSVPDSIEYSIPKFQLSFSDSLIPPLLKLGVHSAFESQNADFSKLSKELYVNQLKHKTQLQVLESGTEAAAVTGVGFLSRSLSQNSVTVDRPFILFLTHTSSSTVLFSGVVYKPEKL